MNNLDDLLLGAITMASAVSGLFFLRYWRLTRDRFFLFFALSFFIEALNRLFLTPPTTAASDTPTFLVVRLISFGLILFAIYDKNRPKG